MSLPVQNIPVNITNPRDNSDEFDQPFIYKGRLAKRINFTTNKITLGPKSSYPEPINFKEEGELIGFTVSTNDPQMAVICIIYDSQNDADTINSFTMREIADIGYGMTRSFAEETNGLGISLDRQGIPHSIKPYLMRYKDTFSNPLSTYDQVKGTSQDKWYTLDYAPVIKEAYSRIFFTVDNLSENTRMIHHMTIRRIKFEDIFEARHTVDPAEVGQVNIF